MTYEHSPTCRWGNPRFIVIQRRSKRCSQWPSCLSQPLDFSDHREPPKDLGTFTEAAPVIRTDVPRTPLRRGAFTAHWEAEQDEEQEAEAQAAMDEAAGGEVHSFGMNGTMNDTMAGSG